MLRLVLFDWNGTLLDDMPQWYAAVRAVFEAFDTDPPTIAEFFAEYQGGHGATIYERYGVSDPLVDLNRTYRAAYGGKQMSRIRLTAGAREVLAALARQGVALGVVTAQSEDLFTPLFARLHLAHLFTHVETDVKDKAGCIQRIVAAEGLAPELCCYVGDAPSDVRAAQRAGVIPIAYLNGYIPAELFATLGPHHKIRRFGELMSLTGGP